MVIYEIIKKLIFKPAKSKKAHLIHVISVITVLATSLVLSGCTHVSKNVNKQVVRIKSQWHKHVSEQTKEKTSREISWNEAYDLMNKNSLSIKKLRNDIKSCHENTRQVYKDLIPSLALSASNGSSIENLPQFNFSNLIFNINSVLNIPNPIYFYKNLYVTKLSYLRSVLAYDLGIRDHSIELYKTFHTYAHLAFREKQLKFQKEWALCLKEVDGQKGERLLKHNEEECFNLKQEQERFQQKLSNLFNCYHHTWILKADTIPQFDYVNAPVDLTDPDKAGLLQMQLTAVELEGARMQLMGMKLGYWPNISFNVTGPPLYDRSGDNVRYFDAEQINLSSYAFWSFDTTGRLSLSIRQTKRQQAFYEAELKIKSRELLQKLTHTQEKLVRLEDDRKTLEQQKALFKHIINSKDFSEFEKIMKAKASLDEKELSLREQIAELSVIFWVMDESKWPAHKDPLIRNLSSG